MRLLDVIMEDEDGVNQLSGILAMFVYEIWSKYKDLVVENSEPILKFFKYCIFDSKEDDENLRKNAAYCFPCMLKMFGKDTEFDFTNALTQLSMEENEAIVRKTVGAQIHEIFKICIENDWSVFTFIRPLINTLNSECREVFTSPLENLA